MADNKLYYGDNLAVLRAGIEVARPERDRGVDLIAYVDRDARLGRFVARPIQMKAATKRVFSLDPKCANFPVCSWSMFGILEVHPTPGALLSHTRTRRPLPTRCVIQEPANG